MPVSTPVSTPVKTVARRFAVLAAAVLLAAGLGGCAQFWRGFRGSVPEWNAPQFKVGTRTSTYSKSGTAAPRINATAPR